VGDSFSFSLEATDGAARRGALRTPHGVVQTPAFMPVGTQGSVKAIRHEDLETAGAQIIEVVDMEEIAAEKQYEFAFLGFPMKLRGATGAPMPSYAVPLK
jgi:kynurenine formamidase